MVLYFKKKKKNYTFYVKIAYMHTHTHIYTLYIYTLLDESLRKGRVRFVGLLT